MFPWKHIYRLEASSEKPPMLGNSRRAFSFWKTNISKKSRRTHFEEITLCSYLVRLLTQTLKKTLGISLGRKSELNSFCFSEESAAMECLRPSMARRAVLRLIGLCWVSHRVEFTNIKGGYGPIMLSLAAAATRCGVLLALVDAPNFTLSHVSTKTSFHFTKIIKKHIWGSGTGSKSCGLGFLCHTKRKRAATLQFVGPTSP